MNSRTDRLETLRRNATTSPPILAVLASLCALIATPALAIDLPGATGATLEWSAAAGPVVSYEVEVGLNGAEFVFVDAVAGTSIDLNGFVTDDTIRVRVRGVDQFGNKGPYSQESDSIVFVPAPAMLLGALTIPNPVVVMGQNVAADSFDITNTGGGELSYTIESSEPSWVTAGLSPNSVLAGQTNTISVIYTTASLAAGDHSATLTVTAPDLTPQTVEISLTVLEPAVLAVNTTSMTVVATGGFNAPSQSFTIENTGGQPLTYTIADVNGDAIDWITAGSSGGVASAGATHLITVDFATNQLVQADYTGTITITATGISGSPHEIAVSLTVTQALGAPGQPVLAP